MATMQLSCSPSCIRRDTPTSQRKSIHMTMIDEFDMFKELFHTRYIRVFSGNIIVDLDDVCVEIKINYIGREKYYMIKCAAYEVVPSINDLSFETSSVYTILDLIQDYRETHLFNIHPALIQNQDYHNGQTTSVKSECSSL